MFFLSNFVNGQKCFYEVQVSMAQGQNSEDTHDTSMGRNSLVHHNYM